MGSVKALDARIISEMVRSGARSRTEIGSRLDMSKASISRAVDRLIASGLVEEGTPFNGSSRGRKTTSLKARSDIAYALGTDLEGMALRACLLDCSGRIVVKGRRAVGGQWSIGRILKQWVSLIEEVLRMSRVPRKKIVGLGAGLPGTISRDGLRVRAYLPPGRWVAFDAAAELGTFRLPITAANNVICVSEYERRRGAANGAGSFVSILARYGLGAATYSDGSFLVGEEAFTGEFGHMRVDIRGPACICGRRGCLDVFASGRTWPARKHRKGPRWSRELARRSRYLAIGLANLLKVFHPPLVIFNGIYNAYETQVRPALMKVLERDLTGLGLSVPEVIFGEPVEFKSSTGAALRAFDAFLQARLIAELLGTKPSRRRRQGAGRQEKEKP